MKPRGLVFGLVFCVAGCLLFLIGGFEHSRRVNYAREHPSAWLAYWEPTAFEEGARWASAISGVAGALLLSAHAIEAIRRRIQ